MLLFLFPPTTPLAFKDHWIIAQRMGTLKIACIAIHLSHSVRYVFNLLFQLFSIFHAVMSSPPALLPLGEMHVCETNIFPETNYIYLSNRLIIVASCVLPLIS